MGDFYRDIIKNMKVSERTKENYYYKAKKAVDVFTDIEGDELELIQELKSLQGYKRNTIMDLINICYLIRRELGLPFDVIIEFRNLKRIENNKLPTEVNETFKLENKVTLPDLLNFRDDLYDLGRYQDYIINFLILEINCRSTDLDITISRDFANNGTDNYLIVENSKVTYIRNNYKTFKRYGQKTNVFYNTKLVVSCNKLLKNSRSVKLLTKKNGDPVTAHNQFIMDKTLNGLGPTKYFKIVVGNSKISDINKLSNNRGTSVNVISKNYNIFQ